MASSNDYEPADHRVVRRPMNNFETFLHMVKASIGTGILAMPHAFSKSGYVIGLIGVVLIGALCTYCERILVSIQYELCIRNKVPSMTYMETSHKAMVEGPTCSKNCVFVSHIANVMVVLFELGCSCVYLLFVSRNIKHIVEHYMDSEYHLIVYMIIVLVGLFLAAMVNSLKFLAILSFLANVSTLVAFGILFGYILTGNPTTENRKTVGRLQDMPLYIGTVVFSMEAIGVVIPLENEMKNPRKFTSTFGVLHFAMIPTIILYGVVGLLGYFNYGDFIEGSITLNLPQGEVMANTCMTLMAFGIFATNVLVLFVTFDIIWKSYISNEAGAQLSYGPVATWAWEYSIRACLIVLSFSLALLVPNLELLISLVGSLCLASAGIFFVALFNLFTYWQFYEGHKFYIFFLWCIIVMIIGIVVLFIGVGTSIKEIYVKEW